MGVQLKRFLSAKMSHIVGDISIARDTAILGDLFVRVYLQCGDLIESCSFMQGNQGISWPFGVFLQGDALITHSEQARMCNKNGRKGPVDSAISWYMIGQNRPRDNLMRTHS